ncbi:MAG TPA: hypothetical protein VKA53_05435 [Thermoanaerobaculia bacterium]|nr:hypothetical protein [Thermoanaerobaculia bacterium]
MSQSETKTREIDGFAYTVHFLDPDRAIDMACELEQLIMPALSEMITVEKDGDTSVLRKAVASAVQRFVLSSDRDRVRKLVHTMMQVTTCDGVGRLGEGEAWKAHFLGRFWSMIRVTVFAVEVNFFDFFGDSGDTLSSVIAQLKEILKGAFDSPPAPAGTSTASS